MCYLQLTPRAFTVLLVLIPTLSVSGTQRGAELCFAILNLTLDSLSIKIASRSILKPKFNSTAFVLISRLACANDAQSRRPARDLR
jgi:hypothetical protein